MCTFLCQYHAVSNYVSVVWLEIMGNGASICSFVIQDHLTSLCFHTNFEITIWMNDWIGILMGLALNLYIALGGMTISTILILQTHKHRRVLHLLVYTFISILNVLMFLSYVFYLLDCIYYNTYVCLLSLIKLSPWTSSILMDDFLR